MLEAEIKEIKEENTDQQSEITNMNKLILELKYKLKEQQANSLKPIK